MKRSLFIFSIVSLTTPCCVAQGYASFLLGGSYFAGGAYVSNAVDPTQSAVNVLAPGMLATLSDYSLEYNFTTIFTTVLIRAVVPPVPGAHVFIRPFGATASIPATVTGTPYGGVTFLVPAGLPLGSAELAWQFDGGLYHSISVSVAKSNFSLAGKSQWSGGGSFGLLSLPSGLTTPSRPGQTLVLSGSGLGTETMVGARVGGLAATVTYTGRDPLRPGYDVIQLQIPTAAPDGCYLPLSLTIGPAVITSTVSVTSDGSPCKHPFQLSVTDMKALEGGGTITTAEISLNTTLQATLTSAAYRQEAASVFIGQSTANDLNGLFPPANPPVGCTAGALAVVGVNVPTGIIRTGDFSSTGDSPPITLTGPNAVLTLKGIDGVNFGATLPQPREGPLTNPPVPVIAGGRWTGAFPDSTTIASSPLAFTLPAPLQLNGGAPLSLRRDRDQTITWDGTGFDALTNISVFLDGHAVDGAAPYLLSCSSAAQTGTITIPGTLLENFAAASIGSLRAQVSLAGASLPHALLKTKTGATGLAIVYWSSGDNRPVDFQ